MFQAGAKLNFILNRCLFTFSSDHGSSSLSIYDEMMEMSIIIQACSAVESIVDIIKS